MPKLLRSSEKADCGATIELDSGEVVYVSIAQIGVLVRLWDTKHGLIRSLLSNFFGPKLYTESSVYKNAQTAEALSVMFPEQAPLLRFKNPVLTVFANAIWHCSSAAEVCTVLNEAREMLPVQEAFEAAKNWPPKRPPEMTPATYRVVYSDGVSQEQRMVPIEIEKWVTQSNEADANAPYRIVRVLDANSNIVWEEQSRS